MRKFNKNCLVFTFAVVMIIFGFCGNTIPSMAEFYRTKFSEMNTGGVKGSYSAAWNTAHENVDRKLFYFDKLMDFNSIKDNVLGTRVVEKENSTIIKTSSGKLHKIDNNRISEEDMEWIMQQIGRLKKASEASNAKFLYCAIPAKVYREELPQNVKDCTQENYDDFLAAMKANDIPYVDFYSELIKKRIKETDIYFDTDHHWRLYPSFVAYQSLCEELGERYGFQYNRDYADISNYSVTTYSDWSLGSWGKKVGRFFTWLGADDFDVISPRFQTSLIERQPYKNETRRGSFDESVLCTNFLEKDYYGVTNYDFYCGGTFRLQIFENEINPQGKKVLLVRDSFGQTITPFLALQTCELHTCDVRNHTQFVGEKLNLEEYIKEIKPEYVIVIYSGAYSRDNSVGYYDFF